MLLPIQTLKSPFPAPEAVQVLSEELGSLRNVLRQRKSNRRGLHTTEPSFTSIRVPDLSRTTTPRPEMDRTSSTNSIITSASNGKDSIVSDRTAQLRVLCAGTSPRPSLLLASVRLILFVDRGQHGGSSATHEVSNKKSRHPSSHALAVTLTKSARRATKSAPVTTARRLSTSSRENTART